MSARILSWGFQLIVRFSLRVDVRDTQSGAKLFRREVLETVMPLLLLRSERYAFDLEGLAVAALFARFDRMAQVPITP